LKKAGKIDKSHDIELFDIPDLSETVEDRIVQNDEARQIREILHEIQDPYKEVFMWRVFAELSFKEIGQIFHKSENWACVTYHRARNMIMKRLEEREYEK
jgi:RNA polymerase sigma-70 factor (ECF subfamily)